ncbi:hypothetical protein EBU94_00340 [bacterium]|nr:hypothetical protein [bacterium]
MENKQYSDWDSIIVQLNLKDEGLLNIKMMRQDLEALAASYGQERRDVVEMMIQTIEEQLQNKQEETTLN